MSRRSRPGWAPALFALATLVALPAWLPRGAEAAESENADAKASWEKGRTLASQKRWDAAIDAFRDADGIDPKAQYKLDLARALVSTSKLREASEVLDEIDAAKEASASIRGAASKLREKIGKRLGTVTVTVTGGGGRAVIEVDGKRVKSGEPLRVDPGKHKLQARSDGWVPMEMELEVGEGKAESVPFKLERDPGFAGAHDDEADEPSQEAPAPATNDDSGGTLLPAAIAWGVSAVGFGVGAIFGVFAFGEADKARENCVDDACNEDARAAIDASKTNGGISTVGFVVGGAGLATGIVLALVYGGGDAPAPTAQAGKIHVTPWIGGEQVGVAGAF